MNLMCRLCGNVRLSGKLVHSIHAETENWSVGLAEKFCHVKFDRNPLLPQMVCIKCVTTIKTFCEYSKVVVDYQSYLKQSLVVKPEKINKTPESCIVISAPNTSIPIELCRSLKYDTDAASKVVFSDEDLDSPLTAEDSNSVANSSSRSASETSSHLNLRKKAVKPCSVKLQTLPIVILKSDSDSDFESDDETRVKRALESSGELNPSPVKRMRLPIISGHRVTQDQSNETVRRSISSSFQSHGSEAEHQSVMSTDEIYFIDEFATDFSKSCYNLPAPLSAKILDGSITEEAAEKFVPWDSIELKCLQKNCDKNTKNPYELLLHNTNHHQNQPDNFIKCSICTDSQKQFNLSQYFHHVVQNHHRHLRYDCLVCSKMFYNFTALFRHYQNAHSGFPGHFCLYDGYLFESSGGLDEHLAIHGQNVKHKFQRRIKMEPTSNTSRPIQEQIFIEADAEIHCDFCSIAFDSLDDLKCHEDTHESSFRCEVCSENFSSNVSLIVHSKVIHGDMNSNHVQ